MFGYQNCGAVEKGCEIFGLKMKAATDYRLIVVRALDALLLLWAVGKPSFLRALVLCSVFCVDL